MLKTTGLVLLALASSLGLSQASGFTENGLSLLSYQLCSYPVTRSVQKLQEVQTSHVTYVSCGGWIPWRRCPKTVYRTQNLVVEVAESRNVTDCCEGYEPFGLYCVLPLNRSREFASRPGVCPTAGLDSPTSPCSWDIDCPGLQKCCPGSGGRYCMAPAPPGAGRSPVHWYNVTVLVKMDFRDLRREDPGLHNHTRLLYSLVSSALRQLSPSIHYLNSASGQDTFTTVSWLLLGLRQLLPVANVSDILDDVVKRVYEVVSIRVQDANECLYDELHTCAEGQRCLDVEGSYQCVVPQQPSTLPPQEASHTGTDCPPIRNFIAFNVTSGGFHVSWSLNSTQNHTFHVQVFRGEALLRNARTQGPALAVAGLDAGTLYSVRISYEGCEPRASATLAVKTDARLFQVTIRITNRNLTEQLLNCSSRDFRDFSQQLLREVERSFPPAISDLSRHGKLRMQIVYLRAGSLVVTLKLTVQDSESPVGVATLSPMLRLLSASTVFQVDQQGTLVQDWDECAQSLEHDCSPQARCINLEGSYTCQCLTARDAHPARAGRICEGDKVHPTGGRLSAATGVTPPAFSTGTTALGPETLTLSPSPRHTRGAPTAGQTWTPGPLSGREDISTVRQENHSTEPSMGVPSAAPSLTPSMGVPSTVSNLMPSMGVPSAAPSLAPSMGIPSTVPNLTPSMGVPSAAPSLTSGMGVPSTAQSLTSGMGVPSAAPSLAPSMGVPSTVPNLTPSMGVPSTTLNLTSGMGVPSTAQSLTSGMGVPIKTPSLGPSHGTTSGTASSSPGAPGTSQAVPQKTTRGLLDLPGQGNSTTKPSPWPALTEGPTGYVLWHSSLPTQETPLNATGLQHEDPGRTTSPGLPVVPTPKGLEPSACIPGPIGRITVSNVTGTSFHLEWGADLTPSPTFHLTLTSSRSPGMHMETQDTNVTPSRLEPGVLYLVKIVAKACGKEGARTQLNVRTAAQTLTGKVRIANIQYSEALCNASSREYQDFLELFFKMVRDSVPAWLRWHVDTGGVRVNITSIRNGSVVVEFHVLIMPDLDAREVSAVFLASLWNTSVLDVVRDDTFIQDYDECERKEDDCAPGTSCRNTFGSFTCSCEGGVPDPPVKYSGRRCEGDSPGSTSQTPGPQQPPAPTRTRATLGQGDSSVPQDPPLRLNLTGAVKVFCEIEKVVIAIQKRFLQQEAIPEASLYLGQPSCNVSDSNGTHVLLVAGWGECGTLVQSNTTSTVVRTTLRNDLSPEGVIHHLQIFSPIHCAFRNDLLTSSGYTPQWGVYSIIEDLHGAGNFVTEMQLYIGDSPIPQNYSVSASDEIKIEVGLHRQKSSLKVVLTECWATPSSNARDPVTFGFINNSCPVPNTYTSVIQNGNSSKAQFKLRIFSFINNSIVYLHCKLRVCMENPGNTCRISCNDFRLLRSTNATHQMTWGPLIRYEGPNAKPVLRTGHIVLIAVAGFTVLAGAVAFLITRYQRMRGKYRLSYHVFSE